MIALLIFLCFPIPAQNGASHSGADPIAAVRQLVAQKRWDEIVRLIPESSDQPAELDYFRGLALARLERWPEAKAAFETGLKKQPRGKRFLLELGGVAYEQKNFSTAKRYLQRALRLDPTDEYARNFVATLYFLDGNLQAALRDWNRVQKPRVEDLQFTPPPKVRPALLDRAFAFSPLSVLKLADFETTKARLDNLEIFPRAQFDLTPEKEDSFSLNVRLAERNGWGDGKLDGILSLFRGLPYLTVYPEYYNFHGSATNLVSLLRWDDNKRRASAALSFPIFRNPQWRFGICFDGRNENWNIRKTFLGSIVPLSDLNLRKEELGAEFRDVLNGRFGWKTGFSFAHRTFRNFGGTTPQAASFFAGGSSLKYEAGLDYQLVRAREKRLTVGAGLKTEVGRFLSGPLGAFGKLEGSLALHWLPQPRGDDYEMSARFRAGKVFGAVPLDELYQLGLERDNSLSLRGHIGTSDGKKGSAPLGREYLLWNWGADKNVLQNGFFTLKLGPLLDFGRITDPSRKFASRGWLVDPGAQCKVRVLGSFTVVFSYGKDLRTGGNAFYATSSR